MEILLNIDVVLVVVFVVGAAIAVLIASILVISFARTLVAPDLVITITSPRVVTVTPLLSGLYVTRR